MKNIIKLFILFIISTILHWAFAVAGAEIGISVNVVFVFAFCACLFVKPAYGYTAAFVCGLFLDFFGTRMFGVYALTFTVLAWSVYFLAARLDFQNTLTQFLAVFILSVLAQCFYSGAGVIFLRGVIWPGFKSLLFGSFFNAAAGVFMFYLFRAFRLSKEYK